MHAGTNGASPNFHVSIFRPKDPLNLARAIAVCLNVAMGPRHAQWPSQAFAKPKQN